MFNLIIITFQPFIIKNKTQTITNQFKGIGHLFHPSFRNKNSLFSCLRKNVPSKDGKVQKKSLEPKIHRVLGTNLKI